VGELTPAAPRKIVVVDDDAVHNRLLRAILERAGYEVATYESGAEAAGDIGRGCDCLITDYHMPGMNGVELIRAIRRKHSPVCIVLTGSDGSSIDEQAEACGVTAVLRKPTPPGLILDFLEAILFGEQRNSPAAAEDPGHDALGKGARRRLEDARSTKPPFTS
jgi:CheY-like chemotaxis protein